MANPSLLAVLLALIMYTITSQALTLPTNIAISIIFPRNTTYGLPSDTFPIVLAMQGASAAWTFGFSLSWRIRRSGCQGQCGVVDSGQLEVEEGQFGGGVSFGEADCYLYVDSAIGLGGGDGGLEGGYVGGYVLEWDFGFRRNCSDDGGVVVSEGGRVGAAGTVGFALGQTPLKQTPLRQMQVKAKP